MRAGGPRSRQGYRRRTEGDQVFGGDILDAVRGGGLGIQPSLRRWGRGSEEGTLNLGEEWEGRAWSRHSDSSIFLRPEPNTRGLPLRPPNAVSSALRPAPTPPLPPTPRRAGRPTTQGAEGAPRGGGRGTVGDGCVCDPSSGGAVPAAASLTSGPGCPGCCRRCSSSRPPPLRPGGTAPRNTQQHRPRAEPAERPQRPRHTSLRTTGLGLPQGARMYLPL